MITADPRHALAVQAFVVACLNLDDTDTPIDPAPFSAVNVRWTPTDYPRAGNLYAMLREVAHVDLGPPERQHRSVLDGEGEVVDLLESDRTISDWTVSVQVVSKLSDADPRLADSAGRILRRLTMRVEHELADDMRSIGCAWRRSGQILPLARIARGSQWETRAAVDLTFAVGEYIVRSVPWIESMAGTGTLAPLGPQPFAADADD